MRFSGDEEMTSYKEKIQLIIIGDILISCLKVDFIHQNKHNLSRNYVEKDFLFS